MAEKKAVKSFLWGALTGAITGAAAALLFAPKSGRELRGDIADTAQKVGEKTAEISRQAGSAVQTLAKRTSGLITDIRSRRSQEAAEAVSTDEKEEEAAAL
ncbi:YtxH domain-containing protein [Cohnella sp. LGH]|uniref:YtxH-like protein n=1 Tax=Cohnella phaseoli TaxID=456490 RepID=A0A3D9KCP2_9BACL|nr:MULTISPECIES: YtxH domain-containing protein [Cohnella]QTH46281.1 YtxH domain-containing protein [Cohnella sp. LGH]RED84301.1 YtxH-like protein [Cohnella phaseoli]